MASNAISYLEEQHQKAQKLLDALEKTTDRGVKTRKELLSLLEIELKHHMQLEEEIFYPAFKAAVDRKKDKKMYFEAKEEHDAAKKVLADLGRADVASLAFGGKAKVLKELIEHHVKEEEEEMFPLANEVLSTEELDELKVRMEAREKQLEAGRSWDRSDVAVHAHD